MTGALTASGLAGGGYAASDAGPMVIILIAGTVLAWHGLRVYTGSKRVKSREIHTARGVIRRPDIDLVAAWTGSGLVLVAIGGLLAIVSWAPVSVIALVLVVAGGLGVVLGLAFFVYLPRRLRPAWVTGRRPKSRGGPTRIR